MGAFNMPPGVSPSDIPGVDDGPPELNDFLAWQEERDQLICDSMEVEVQWTKEKEKRQEELGDKMQELIINLASEAHTADMLREENDRLRKRLEKYGQHYPSCSKVASRLGNRLASPNCTCGLEEA